MNENLSVKQIEIPVEGDFKGNRLNIVKEQLNKIAGITGVKLYENGIFRIEYYPYVLSAAMIREKLVSLGTIIKENKKIRNPFKRFIYKLAESNEKTFGSETLECCKLNKKPGIISE